MKYIFILNSVMVKSNWVQAENFVSFILDYLQFTTTCANNASRYEDTPICWY